MDKKLKGILKNFGNDIDDEVAKLDVTDLKLFEQEILNNFSQRMVDFYPQQLLLHDILDGYKPEKKLHLAIENLKTLEDVRQYLMPKNVDKTSQRLLSTLVKKGLNKINEAFVNEQKSGEVATLKVLTYNAFLLYSEPMASNDVYERSEKIGKAIAAMKESPDIVVFQEVWPHDMNKIQTDGSEFVWPNSKDWPMRDLKILTNTINKFSKRKYFDPLVEFKQAGGRYMLGSVARNKIAFESKTNEELFYTDPANQLNMGPAGLVVLVARDIDGLTLDKGIFSRRITKKKKFNIQKLGSFYSNYDRGQDYNNLSPVSRGLLNTLINIEGFGTVEASTTHLSTGTFNTNRTVQIAQIMHEMDLKHNEPQAYALSMLNKLVNFVCKAHTSNNCANLKNLNRADYSELKKFLTTSWSELNPNHFDMNELVDIFKYMDSFMVPEFLDNHIGSIVAGDFNLQPYGDFARPILERNFDQWAYQLFLTDVNNLFAFDATDIFQFTETFNSKENKLAAENDTSPRSMLERNMREIKLKLGEDKLDAFNKIESVSNKVADKILGAKDDKPVQLDYIMMNTNVNKSSDKFVSFYKSAKVVFKNSEPTDDSDDPENSDHWGVFSEINLYKKK